MIENNNFELYSQLVKDNHFKDMFDLGIIYQVVSTIKANDLEIKFEDSQDFKCLCNEVKRQYLKYDKDLNDDLVLEVMNDNLSYKQMITELIETEYQGYENSSEYKNIMANIDNITINVLPKINSDLTIEEELDIVWKEINKYEIESEI